MRALLLLATLLTCSISRTTLAADFRLLSWGATEGEILVAHSSETPVIHQDRTLAWEAELGDLKVFVFYVFDENGKLRAAGYDSREEHGNNHNHIDDYANLNQLLREKYAGSEEYQTYWRNDLYRDDPSQRGIAISSGHLQYWWEHETDRTRIKHYLDSDGSGIQHTVRYEQKITAAEQAEEDRAQLLEDL